MAYEKSKVSNFGSGTLSSPPPLVGFEYCHQFSRVPGEAPELGSLGEGELALNTADGVAYYRTAGGGVGSFPAWDSIADKPLFGTTLGSFCEGNDSRLKWRGTWNPNAEYLAGDVVVFYGATYRTSAGVQPQSSDPETNAASVWERLASKTYFARAAGSEGNQSGSALASTQLSLDLPVGRWLLTATVIISREQNGNVSNDFYAYFASPDGAVSGEWFLPALWDDTNINYAYPPIYQGLNYSQVIVYGLQQYSSMAVPMYAYVEVPGGPGLDLNNARNVHIKFYGYDSSSFVYINAGSFLFAQRV